MYNYVIQDCVTRVVKDISCVDILGVGLVYKFLEYPDTCFQCVDLGKDGAFEEVTYIHKSDTCETCLTPDPDIQPCQDERTIAYATRIKLPEPAQPDRGFKECCFSLKVLADANSSKSERNDFNSFYFKRQSPSDTCDFILVKNGIEYDLTTGIYGQFKALGTITSQPNLATIRVEWKKVLATLGEGNYNVKLNQNIVGITITQMSNTFELEQFTTRRADKTIRIDSLQDGRLVHLDVDFFGTGFETSLRVGGFFGNAQRKFEEDIVTRRNYVKEQIKETQTTEYSCETNLLPECITSEIYDFMLMANRIFVSDYNSNNHSYKYTRLAVKLADAKDAEYPTFKRSAKLSLTFTDELINKVKQNY